ncbi:MAG: tetratricopeptide repeat protein, partial [Sedimentisphaerales bacterium]
AIDEKSFGKDHPEVVIDLNNLAVLLADTNRLTEAEPLMKWALTIDEKSFGKDHPKTANDTLAMANLLRDKGDYAQAATFYQRLLKIHAQSVSQHTIQPQIAFVLAICHNNLAFHKYVPAMNWNDAELHYRQSIELFNQSNAAVEAANVEINLQTLFHLSGKPVNIDKIRKLTDMLEKAGDHRAKKGLKLLAELAVD